ncbi:MAG TPA: hypothetical protein VNR64_10630 [Vicinamibacterales bacterium]|nr:hypothetical protein [Vicinamibacterales bacterium]
MQIILTLIALALTVVQSDAARDALRLGRTSDQDLYNAFNAGYQLAPSGSVSKAEVITEFRRAVLIVRDHANQGEYGFTERDLEHAIAHYRGLVTLIIEVRLNPLNTYIKAPAYSLYIESGPASKPIAPRSFERTAAFGVPMPSPGTPLTGVRLEGTFSVADITSAPAPTVVVVDDKGDVLWRARLDLTRFR